MLQIKWFPHKNTWRNLWGLLGDVGRETNDFITKHSTRGQNGVNVGNYGTYIVYEDGIFAAAQQAYVLNDQKMKNLTQYVTQKVVYETVKRKIESTNARLAEIEKELSDLEGSKDADYKEIKPKIDILKSERDYLNNQVLKNAQNEILPVKADMDRLEEENKTIDEMLEVLSWE